MVENDDERLRSNLARLKDSLDKARATREAQSPAPTTPPNQPKADPGMSLAMRAGSEFISAILVGAAIGWGLDRILGTNPLFLIVFFFIGVAAGVWNVIRLTSPKGGGSQRDSRLSHTEAADKGLRPSDPRAARGASQRGTSGGANGAGDGPDDDED